MNYFICTGFPDKQKDYVKSRDDIAARTGKPKLTVIFQKNRKKTKKPKRNSVTHICYIENLGGKL